MEYNNNAFEETKTSYADVGEAGGSLVFPELQIDKWPSARPTPVADPRRLSPDASKYCSSCAISGFTTEPDVSYEDVNFILPNYIDYSLEDCIEECKNMPGCNTYRWQKSNKECYLIATTGEKRADSNGISGRSCLAVTECNANQILVILSNAQSLGWTVQENCEYAINQRR